MDMFFAACEERENPLLRNKIFAVGSTSMLSTANYEARKFGIRAGMPGFIGQALARKLAKRELCIVPVNFPLYSSISADVQKVFQKYDPNYSMMSLDEAYLDFTHHIRIRPEMAKLDKSVVDQICPKCTSQNAEIESKTESIELLKSALVEKSLCTMRDKNNPDKKEYENLCSILDIPVEPENIPDNFESESKIIKLEESLAELINIKNSQILCETCHRTFYDDDIESAVEEMRRKVQKSTRLTCSAGIAPNGLIAKICSDFNKPNGQHRIEWVL